MRTRATLLNLSPAETGTTDNHLVISLAGEDTGSERPRLGIVPVVDRSGSMGSADKLGIVTRALGYLSSYLGDDDHLALVAFDTTVDTILPATAADAAGAARFASALKTLRPRASTNLADGIRHGLAAASSMPTDALVRVIVLTDGLANCGERTRPALLGLLSDIPEHVSVSFLGVGTDCDHDLLGALAAAGRGSYGFIEAADRAADVLGAEVGGLLETEVHRVKVTVATRGKYVQLTPAGDRAVLGLGGAYVKRPEPGVVEVEVGQLLVGQTRHLVLPVTAAGPKRKHARPVTVAEVTVTGVIDDTDVRVEMLPKAHFGGPSRPVDEDVAAAVELAQVADAQQRAEAAAAVGDFAQAQSVFAGLDLHSGAALGMSQSLAMNYSDSNTYGQSATMRSSSTHALRGSLAGSGEAFDALAARTIGSYTTSGQRDVASATAQAATPSRSGRIEVTSTKGGSGTSTTSSLLAETIAQAFENSAGGIGHTTAARSSDPGAEAVLDDLRMAAEAVAASLGFRAEEIPADGVHFYSTNRALADDITDLTDLANTANTDDGDGDGDDGDGDAAGVAVSR